MRKMILIFAVLGLAGCALTPEQQAAAVKADVDRMIATYGPGCDRLGYKSGDDKWRDCVLRLAQREERRYYNRPLHTSCWGHRGFYHCSTF